MLALQRRIDRHRARCFKLAQAACRLADELGKHLTPALLETNLRQLRHETIAIEAAITDWETRTPRRRQRMHAFRNRFGPSPLIGQHSELCQAFETSLQDERQILRQIGDTLAWIVLRADPHLIAPL